VHAVSSGSSGIVRTIVGLFIVIAVIYGVAWILRSAKRSKNRGTGEGLDQLANLPLGGGRSVALVRVGPEVVLVGIAEQGVTPIRTYTEDEAVAMGLMDPADDETPPAAGGLAPRAARRAPKANVVDTLRRLTVRS
jgi:flagellar protein FliO/FliZ